MFLTENRPSQSRRKSLSQLPQ
jgi:hypothetical protein